MLRCFYDPLSAETPLSQPLAMAKIRFEIPQKAAGCGGSDRPTAHWQYLEDFPFVSFWIECDDAFHWRQGV